MCLPDLDGCAAFATPAPEPDTRDCLVADDGKFLDLHLEVRDTLACFPEQHAISVMAPVGLDHQLVCGRPPLDVRVEIRERSFEVAAIEGVITVAHNPLHVLLRHPAQYPSCQSGGQPGGTRHTASRR